MAREIEVKLLADGVSYQDVLDYLKQELMPLVDSFKAGTSIDAYWKALPHASGSFLRLRVSDAVELTAKANDRGGIEDRAEWNVPVSSEHKDSMMEALAATLGDPSTVMWRFADFRLNKDTTISAIQNIEQPQYAFVEVESTDRNEVVYWTNKLSLNAQFTLKQVRNSFFDIFVQKHGILL